MKPLFTFALCLLAIVGQAATPSTKSFRGAGGINVTSNDTTAIIIIDGSSISSPTGGVSAAVATNIAQYYVTNSTGKPPAPLSAVLFNSNGVMQGSANLQFSNGSMRVYGPTVFEADRYNVKAYGAVGDGATDDTVAVRAALAAASNATLVFPNGTYKVSVGATPLNASNVRLLAPGGNATITNISGDTLMQALGTIGAFSALGSNAVVGTNILWFSAGNALLSTLTPGDLVKIISSAPFQPSAPTALQGEIGVVSSVNLNNNTLTLLEGVHDNYASGSTGRVARISPTSFQLGKGMRLAQYTNTDLTTTLYIQYAFRPSSEGEIVCGGYVGMVYDDCWGIEDASFIHDQYLANGINNGALNLWNGCTHARIRGVYMNAREGVGMINGNGVGGVAWDIKCIGAVAGGNVGPTGAGFNSDRAGSVSLLDCTVVSSSTNSPASGVHVLARYTVIRNLTVEGCDVGVRFGGFIGTGDRFALVDIDGVRGTTFSGQNKNAVAINTGYDATTNTIARLIIRNIFATNCNYAVDIGSPVSATSRLVVEQMDIDGISVSQGSAFILRGTGNTFPEQIRVARSKVFWPTLDIATVPFFLLSAGNVKQVVLDNCSVDNAYALIQCNDTFTSINVNNCYSRGRHGIYFSAGTTTNLVLSGSYFKGDGNGYCVLASPAANLNISIIGSTIQPSWVSTFYDEAGKSLLVTDIGSYFAAPKDMSGGGTLSYVFGTVASGNVGIQTAIPSSTLDVAGQVRAASAIISNILDVTQGSATAQIGTLKVMQSAGLNTSYVTNGLFVGPSGVGITNTLFGSASLDFPSTLAGTSSDLPITVTGVVSNNCHVSLCVPWEAASGGGIFTHFESNGVIYVRFSNNQLTLAIDPTPATFSALAFRVQ